MSLVHHQSVCLSSRGISRRSFFHHVSAAAIAAGTLSFRDIMALKAEELRQQGMSMILLFMQGAPSQFETFDPKPGMETGGPTKAIKTAVPGIEIAQGWEKTAQSMQDIALIRSMTNKEGNHQRAQYQLHTGYVPSGSVKYPSLGCSLAKELGDPEHDLPGVVSVGRTVGAGFLGVDYEPFLVNNPGQLPQNIAPPLGTGRLDRRLGLLDELQDDFASRGGARVVADHKLLYEKTARLVRSPEVKAFDLSNESAVLRARYGESQFGRGCLLARRLIESGVTFVEVTSNGWDTHDNNFERVGTLAQTVDPALSALIEDLKDRGRLDKTLVVWTGEFGRTPRINPRTGRDHYPRVFNAAMAGGGVKGGQVIGSSTKDGSAVERDPVTVADLFTTICKSMNVDPRKENLSPIGRPLKIVDGGEVVQGLLG